MANISNIINVALIEEGAAAARDNMNVCAVFTSNQDYLSTDRRYALFVDSASVAEAFGSGTAITKHAQTFFAQSPNPVNASGVFVAAYWRGQEETTDATAAVLEGAQLSEATIVSELQQITDGAFDIDIDGTTENITSVDFQSVSEFADIVDILNDELTGATASLGNQQIVITSDTTGVTSTITFFTDPGTGTYVGDILALSDGSGATTTQGADSEVLTVETKVEAATAVKALVNFKGSVFVDDPTESEVSNLAAWAQANSTLMYDVFSSADNLEKDITNVVWKNTLSGYDNYRMLYSKAGNRRFATAYMARAHVVSFTAENTALTMNLKELAGVLPESYTQTEITKAKTVGLDIYTTVKDVPVVLTSGANDFVDNRYNLIAFIDAVQTDLFNLLKLAGTKIPQTTRGVNQLVDQGEKTTRGFVRAGVFAPGVWTRPDFFGEQETFKRNIRQFGFYWKANRLSDQPTADRQARKSPVLQAAVKNAGAIHSADVIINFNL